MQRSATTVATPSERANARNERRRESLREERQRDRARDERRAARRTERPSARDRRTRNPGAPVSDPGAPVRDPGAPGDPVRGEWGHVVEPPPERGLPGRHTFTITGLGAEGYATRHGTRASAAQRHQVIKRHERAGFRPDRVAMWAVMLGVMLTLAAASSHAAVLAHHMLAH